MTETINRPKTVTVSELFQAAHSHHAQALVYLEKRRLRQAGGQGWKAALAATNGLILARAGQEPADSWQAHTLLLTWGQQEPELTALGRRFSSLGGGLYMGCVCDGICGPAEVMARDLAEVHSYIKDAARLAGEDAVCANRN